MKSKTPEAVAEAVSQHGVIAYHAWLEMGACVLATANVSTHRSAILKAVKEHNKGGEALRDSFDKNPLLDPTKIVKAATLSRAKTIFVQRFPEVLDICKPDKLDDVVSTVVRFGNGSGQSDHPNPYVRQVDHELTLIELIGKKRLIGGEAVRRLEEARDGIVNLRQYWQPRTFGLWLRTENAATLVPSQHLAELSKIACRPSVLFGTDLKKSDVVTGSTDETATMAASLPIEYQVL